MHKNQEVIRKFKEKFENERGYLMFLYLQEGNRQEYSISCGEEVKSFLLSALDQRDEEWKKRIEEAIKTKMTDERKVAQFGIWQADTYNDKMLVNAVLKEVRDGLLLEPKNIEG